MILVHQKNETKEIFHDDGSQPLAALYYIIIIIIIIIKKRNLKSIKRVIRGCFRTVSKKKTKNEG
jgi:hypothetical protein